jgi:serine protease
MIKPLTAFVAAAAALTAASPAAAAPNDPLYGKQYGPQQVRAEQAWSTSTGSGQRIAIVDSGVDLDHPDLDGKIAGGATFVCEKVSPCGNGDWQSGADNGSGDPHGTHVAGIAAAETNNATGIAGVAPDASILAVKVLDAEGAGSFEDIAAGIRWSADNGADVINMSLGALPGVQALTVTGLIADTQDAIAYARSKGVVVVAAAGNESSPLCGTPAFERGALCVTSTDRNEAKSWFSNLGVNQEIDAVAAPGGQGLVSCAEDILSTVPAGAETTCGRTTPGYDAYAGTSMAAPHVAGVAALLTAQGRTDEQVVDVLETTARKPVTGTRGVFDPVYGYGIVDAQAAVAAPGAVAPAPTPTTSPSKGGTKPKR